MNVYFYICKAWMSGTRSKFQYAVRTSKSPSTMNFRVIQSSACKTVLQNLQQGGCPTINSSPCYMWHTSVGIATEPLKWKRGEFWFLYKVSCVFRWLQYMFTCNTSSKYVRYSGPSLYSIALQHTRPISTVLVQFTNLLEASDLQLSPLINSSRIHFLTANSINLPRPCVICKETADFQFLNKTQCRSYILCWFAGRDDSRTMFSYEENHSCKRLCNVLYSCIASMPFHSLHQYERRKLQVPCMAVPVIPLCNALAFKLQYRRVHVKPYNHLHTFIIINQIGFQWIQCIIGLFELFCSLNCRHSHAQKHHSINSRPTRKSLKQYVDG